MSLFDILLAQQIGGGGSGKVVIRGDITCTDDGEGNITITEEENNG